MTRQPAPKPAAASADPGIGVTVVVGITGATGAGKSLLATRIIDAPRGQAFAAQRGRPWADHLEVDGVGHTVLQDPMIRARIVECFGQEVLDPSGQIERRRLGRLVFADRQQRARLDAIMHPPMIEVVERHLAEVRSRGTLVALINAALLLRMGLDRRCDRIIQVRATAEVRLRRLTELRGMAVSDARTRLDAQDPPPQPSARVLTCDNNGHVADLDRWIDTVLFSALGFTE